MFNGSHLLFCLLYGTSVRTGSGRLPVRTGSTKGMPYGYVPVTSCRNKVPGNRWCVNLSKENCVVITPFLNHPLILTGSLWIAHAVLYLVLVPYIDTIRIKPVVYILYRFIRYVQCRYVILRRCLYSSLVFVKAGFIRCYCRCRSRREMKHDESCYAAALQVPPLQLADLQEGAPDLLGIE